MGLSVSWREYESVVESLAIFTSSRAERYGVFFPRWWKAISELERQPEQIVIAYHESNLAKVPESVPKEYASRVKLVISASENGLDYPNLCVESADTDWVAFCGLDDQVLPNAYDELELCLDAEILVANLKLSDGSNSMGSWDLERMKHQNPMAFLSPFRKSLWQRVHGIPKIYWSDWGFWIKCAMAGATTYQSQNFQALFDLGVTHETESGPQLDRAIRLAADEELVTFAKEIGFRNA
jgi:hypothetical protein